MRIESIELENFRQYRKEVFNFPKINGKGDIHIIIGENGEGKTNILNALTWCLYGQELHLGDHNTALKNINTQFVQELRQKGQKSGQVQVIVTLSIENGSSIRIMRTSVFSITPGDAFETKQDLTAIIYGGRTGDRIIENKEEVDMYIARYVPQEINDYIFFDGELMDQYFKSEQRRNIENGIKDLTQVSTIEKTKKALEQYQKTELSPLLSRFGDKTINDAQEELHNAETNQINQQNKIEVIKGDIKQMEEKLRELDRIIHGHDNLRELTDKLRMLEFESDQLKKRERDNYDSMIKFIREYYVYLSLYPAMKAYYDYIHKQERAGNLPPKIDKNLVQAICDNKECAICGNKLDTTHLQHVLDILHKLEVSTATSAALNRASSALTGYFERIKQYPTRKDEYRRNIDEIKKDISRNNNDYQELSERLKNIPNQDAIREAIEQKESCKTILNEQRIKLGREDHILEMYSKVVGEAQKKLDDALKKNALMGKYQHQFAFCGKSIYILHDIINEILDECRKEMQVVTFDIFNKLMWKKDAFSKVEILDDYSFQLLDTYGEQALGSCSAAERALLALSFTVALQQTSGHDSLLYIDTPLGRVGEKNRINFTAVLAEISEKKQVILSFTPTEYDDNVRAQLANKYSSYCELMYKDGVTNKKK